jgi:hypothetical protein
MASRVYEIIGLPKLYAWRENGVHPEFAKDFNECYWAQLRKGDDVRWVRGFRKWDEQFVQPPIWNVPIRPACDKLRVDYLKVLRA